MRSSRGSLINKESTSSLKSNSEDVRVMESPSGSNEDLGVTRRLLQEKRSVLWLRGRCHHE